MSLKSDIESLLLEVDIEFEPRISSKNNITDYAQKLVNQATVFPVYIEGVLVAFIAIYCNNYETKIAYLSMIAVKKELRGGGIGLNLVEIATKYIKSIGFKTFRLEVYNSNTKAISLYSKLGFIEKENGGDSVFMELAI